VTAKYPDIPDVADLSDDEIDDGVWSDGPLINNASGPLFYFGLAGTRFDEAAPFVVDVAREHGLVCFDPQDSSVVR
jgi:hypothetical protein